MNTHQGSEAGPLTFTLSKSRKSRLNLQAPAEAQAYVICSPSPSSSSRSGGSMHVPRLAAAGFASISLGSGDSNACSTSTGTRGMPLFMIASATETKKSKGNVPEASAWRVAMGNLAAGATAGCAVEAALYPIDTIKTRLQVMIGGGGLKALLQAGGGKALYAGVWGNLAGVAPSSALFMACYEPVKQAVQKDLPEDKQYIGPMVAGVAAGLVSSLTRVPTEVIKSRLQTKEFAGVFQAIRAVVAREGLRGMYAGYGAFLLRDLPFDAIEFVTYEQLKRTYQVAVKRELHPAETSVAGAIAGGFTGVITTPLDVLKTRLMTQGTAGRYKNVFDAAVQIARTEGMAAFFSGWQPRFIWISIGGFVFFPVLEAAKKFYGPKPAELPVTPLRL